MGKRAEPPAEKSSVPNEGVRQRLNAAIGERIREVRNGIGMGQAECARDAGIDKSSMFRLESGAQNITVETLARIAHALGVGMDRLVSGIGIETPPAADKAE